MAKTVFDAMKQSVIAMLSEIALEVVEFDEVEKKLDDGEIQKNLRFLVEIPKGNAEWSKVRFSVKTPLITVPFTKEQVEEDEVMLYFVNLELSYVDGKQNCYFKAENFKIVEV